MAREIRHDLLPWYRQFWPWFLIALPASVVVAGLTTLYIANKHADDLVVDDYYRNGLAINRQLANKNRATQLGITAEIELSGHAVTARLSGPVEAGRLQLLLSHPLEADRDQTIDLLRVAPGLYSGPLERYLAARWHWTLVNAGEPGWRLDGSVEGSPTDNARLDRGR